MFDVALRGTHGLVLRVRHVHGMDSKATSALDVVRACLVTLIAEMHELRVDTMSVEEFRGVLAAMVTMRWLEVYGEKVHVVIERAPVVEEVDIVEMYYRSQRYFKMVLAARDMLRAMDVRMLPHVTASAMEEGCVEGHVQHNV